MPDVSLIRNYILYLKEQCGLSITLHPTVSDSVFSAPQLNAFNFHDNSFCIFLKSCPNAYNHCIDRQDKIIAKCKDGAYIGTCYAGVREFIYPISDSERIIGFISISGYKTENYQSYLNSVSDKYCISSEKLELAYMSLKDTLPPKKEVDTLVIPLCYMLELACIKDKDSPRNVELDFASRVVAYIKRYHTQNITSEDICNHFSCSRSYMSTKFNEHTGMSIRAFINSLRLDDAKSLLKYSNLSVTEIAYSVGFADSNYFSSLFKNKLGLSPSDYRNSVKKTAL